MALELRETELAQLHATADRLGVSVEDLLRVGVDYLLKQPDTLLADLLNGDPGKASSNFSAVTVAEPSRSEERSDLVALLAEPITPDPDAWLTQYGIFADDPLIAEILEEGRRWREGEQSPE